MSALDEEWAYNDGEGQVYYLEKEPAHLGPRWLPIAQHCTGWDDSHGRLAAAAPDLYRALDAIEWIDHANEAGNWIETSCPSCGALKPEAHPWSGSMGHAADCELNAALRKARGE